jgi:hypothetical protein
MLSKGKCMNIARLGAAGAVAAVIALGAAAPAFATNTPNPPSGGDVQKTTPQGGDQKQGTEPTADVNPKFFYGGDVLTFTVEHCRVHPQLVDVDNLFVGPNQFTGNDGSWVAKVTTSKNLVEGKEYKVIVKCGRWSDTFTTKPHKKPKPTPTPSTPTTAEPSGVPSGAPQTGDGSSTGGGNMGLVAGGAGVVLVGLAGGAFLYTRRRSSAGA